MNYEVMSDFELNQALTCLVYKCDGWELSKTGRSFYSCGVDGSESHVQHVPSYCTDWNAVMPLAVEHGVSLICTGSAGGVTYSATDGFWHHSGSIFSDNDEIQCNGKPLRAIVICLIKVLERKKWITK